MAPKKAAKKVAKKAAKKAPGSRRGQDLRRCYEHFGRVLALLPHLSESDTVHKMASLAQQLVSRGEVKDAADVIRAAEHMSFGRLAVDAPEETISDQLTEALRQEYTHLLERGDHHAASLDTGGAIGRLYSLMRKQAAAAFRAKKFRAASELARGAEALSHITTDVTGRLRAGDLQQLEAGE